MSTDSYFNKLRSVWLELCKPSQLRIPKLWELCKPSQLRIPKLWES
jgi:hypothetical protein